MDGQLERNKNNVTAFHDLMFNQMPSCQCPPAEAIKRYAGEVYIQHHPAVADGKIVEPSDVLQRVPQRSVNDNTMF